jgi:hypothetical protein
MHSRFTLLVLGGLAVACSSPASGPGAERTGKIESAVDTASYNTLNPSAGRSILYEAQIRSANACDPAVGSATQRAQCVAKPAPVQVYRQQAATCPTLSSLQQFRLGTIDDMLAPTTDFESGITLRYVKETVGATTLWLMPPFPDNDTWSVPDPCDNLGSPYAVRDYFHVSGALSRACIAAGADERSATPCWGNADLDALIAQAHALGLTVMLDVALNHFGHNFQMYDVEGVLPIRDRVAAAEDLDDLWSFGATYEAALVSPRLIDTPAALATLAANDASVSATLAALDARCPGLDPQTRVTAFHAYREAFDWDRAAFPCTPATSYLEFQDPGFYLGADSYDPSTQIGDDFASQWPDVKFLFHHEENSAHTWEFVRQREYTFRILNYWLSRGVDGFRMDHTTDPNSGMGANEWKYLTTKLDYYNALRGMPQPIYLAEEFAEESAMSKVSDVMTEGYVGDMCGRSGEIKNASYVEGVTANTTRFGGKTFVMTALEDHDELRLMTNTGFDVWTGAGFWGIGATLWSTPMMLMGQELGESSQLNFRRADYLRSRFVGSPSYDPNAATLASYYRTLATARLAPENRALVAPSYAFLRTRAGDVDERIFAAVKWSSDLNVVFVFHNLWQADVAQSYSLPPDLAGTIGLSPTTQYRLVDAITGDVFACQSGASLAANLFVSMGPNTLAQWLRLEECGP